MKLSLIGTLGLILTSSVFLIGCGQIEPVASDPSLESDGKPLKIVTTFPPLYAHTANIIDDNDVLTNLVPPGSSIHFWQPKPSDIIAMEEADLIITNGLGLEEFLTDYLESLEMKGVKIIYTSTGISTMEFEQDDEDEHEDDHDDDHDDEHEDDHKDHDHEGPDPHVWLDPNNAIIQASNITRSFIDLDPSQEKYYSEASSSYKNTLENLDTSIKNKISNSEIQPFIVFHDAYQYFLNAYGLENSQVGLVQEFHGDNPSQKDIAEIIEVIEKESVKTIYTEPQFNPSVVTRLQQETGVQTREIDPIGNELNKQEYIRMMEKLADAFTSV